MAPRLHSTHPGSGLSFKTNSLSINLKGFFKQKLNIWVYLPSVQLCQLAKTKPGFLVSPQWAAGSSQNRGAQGRGLSPGHRPPSNEEELEPRGQEKRRVSRPHLPHTSGDWKIWSVSPSIRAIKKVISPLPWKPKTEMWKEGNPFPCGYILMWPVPLVKNEGPFVESVTWSSSGEGDISSVTGISYDKNRDDFFFNSLKKRVFCFV